MIVVPLWFSPIYQLQTYGTLGIVDDGQLVSASCFSVTCALNLIPQLSCQVTVWCYCVELLCDVTVSGYCVMLRLPRCEVLTQVLQKIKVMWDVTILNNGPCNTCCSVSKLCFLPFSVFLCHIQQEEDCYRQQIGLTLTKEVVICYL